MPDYSVLSTGSVHRDAGAWLIKRGKVRKERGEKKANCRRCKKTIRKKKPLVYTAGIAF